MEKVVKTTITTREENGRESTESFDSINVVVIGQTEDTGIGQDFVTSASGYFSNQSLENILISATDVIVGELKNNGYTPSDILELMGRVASEAIDTKFSEEERQKGLMKSLKKLKNHLQEQK
jgi:hypothetical protein